MVQHLTSYHHLSFLWAKNSFKSKVWQWRWEITGYRLHVGSSFCLVQKRISNLFHLYTNSFECEHHSAEKHWWESRIWRAQWTVEDVWSSRWRLPLHTNTLCLRQKKMAPTHGGFESNKRAEWAREWRASKHPLTSKWWYFGQRTANLGVIINLFRFVKNKCDCYNRL